MGLCRLKWMDGWMDVKGKGLKKGRQVVFVGDKGIVRV